MKKVYLALVESTLIYDIDLRTKGERERTKLIIKLQDKFWKQLKNVKSSTTDKNVHIHPKFVYTYRKL